MILPESVRKVLDRLEEAGFESYVVGGCVRDALLGLRPHDYDVCTAALPEQTMAVFSDCRQILAGRKHGTVGVLTADGPVEITTYRTEGDYGDCRHPGWVKFVPDLRSDLARRDFTVNAMAWSPRRGLADPFGGRQDLRDRVLRAVGEPSQRFREDALRILRGLRFSARFSLEPETRTKAAMEAEKGLLDQIARERIREELNGFLLAARPEDLLRWGGILAQAVEELGPMQGFCQHSPHHDRDVWGHTAQVVGNLPREEVLRWAGLLHDVAKPRCFSRDEQGVGHFYGHAALGAELSGEILHGLRCSTELTEEVQLLVAHHMDLYEPTEKQVRRLLSRYGKPRLERLLTLMAADRRATVGGKTEDLEALWAMALELSRREGELSLKTLAVRGSDLLALGIPAGPELGGLLHFLLEGVLSGEFPNEKEALLAQIPKKSERID